MKEGIKKITPKARIITLKDGSIQIIKGGLGTSVSERDARKILNQSGKINLTKSLRIKNGVK